MFQTTMLQQLIKGLDPIHTKTIHLQKGQLFQGQITKIYPGQLAQLQLGGLNVTAKLEAQLEKGERYWFRVLGGDGIPKLKVLENAPTSPNPNLKNEHMKSPQSLLQQIGLPTTQTNERIVRQFIQSSIPFTVDNIRTASGLVTQSLNTSEEDLQIMIQLMKKGLPLTKETFLSMRSLQSADSMGDKLNALVTGLREQQQYPQLQQLIGRITQDPTALLQLTDQGTGQQVFKQLIQYIGLQFERDIGEQIQRQHPLNQASPSLKAQLLDFLQNSPPSLGALKEHGEFLVHRITAMQLLSSETNSPMQQIVVQLPFVFGEMYRDVTIQWEGRKLSNGVIDENHCRIMFYLKLEQLDETVIDVQIQKRVVSVTIYNDAPKPSSLNETWNTYLTEKLEPLEYQLSTIKWVQSTETEKKPLPMEDKPSYSSENYNYRGVDVRI